MTAKYTQRNDPAWLEITERLVEVCSLLDQLKEEYQALKEQLIDLSNNESSIGGGIRLLNSKRKGTIDYSKIPELESVDLECYRKPPTEGWTLTSINKKPKYIPSE